MKSPAFSFYVRDWLCSKTVSKLHSKNISKGVSGYLYLLCNAWLEEPQATLPCDLDELACLARTSREEFDKIWPLIKDQFVPYSEERLQNERLMAESNKQHQRRLAGSKGGSKKVANHLANHLANDVAAHEDENEDEKEIESDLNNEVKNQAEAVYEAYPKKVGKPKAIQAILKSLRKTSFEDILKKTEEYRRSRNGEDPKFTPNPATWFNQERYNDDAATWKNEYDFKKPKPVGGNF